MHFFFEKNVAGGWLRSSIFSVKKSVCKKSFFEYEKTPLKCSLQSKSFTK